MLKRVKFLPDMFSNSTVVVELGEETAEIPWGMRFILAPEIQRVLEKLQMGIVWEYFYECSYSLNSEQAILGGIKHYRSDAAYIKVNDELTPVVVRLHIPFLSDYDIFSALLHATKNLDIEITSGDVDKYNETFEVLESGFIPF